MRFQITADWALAGVLLPAGTIIDTADPDCPAKGLTIPLTATPLDQESWEEQLRLYPDHRHLLRGAWQ